MLSEYETFRENDHDLGTGPGIYFFNFHKPLRTPPGAKQSWAMKMKLKAGNTKPNAFYRALKTRAPLILLI